ncbi:flippase-like domain-containing protein [Tardiphaga sp. vice304]|uniref:lysylphosphatidylglycerol synthase transmembrane domain-containing protein n=1 Tax=Tardiphaga sp. vice304 TaxID=2592817 RepID=UPI0011638E4C|nr:lysylphosphatidylglycerol synthase transmembrane domain-containing protein [Tardiphaga sp. vice304]QDM28171.1 flippase-like domain-containing protein [Tardiphaga sp. vice304]
MGAILIRKWAALVGSLLLLGAVYLFARGTGAASLVAVWQKINGFDLFLATLLVFVVQVATAWRLQIIFLMVRVPASLFSLLRVQLIVLFVAHGLPVSALADIAKVAMMSLRFGLRARDSTRIVVYERLIAAGGLVALGIIAVFVSWLAGLLSGGWQIEAAVWLASFIGLVGLVGLSQYKCTVRIAVVDGIVREANDLGRELADLSVAGLLLVSLVVQLGLSALAFLVLSHSAGLPLTIWQLALAMPFVTFVASLPIFYLGWGGREAAVVMTLGTVSGVSPAEAGALSVAFGVCVLLAAMPGGLLWLLRPSLHR